MKIGDTVTIYDDPITEKMAVGKARLQKHISNCGSIDGDILELWDVHFLDDDDSKSHYGRMVRQHN